MTKARKIELSTEIIKDVDTAARLLQEGKLVAFATETVYGLGADALNSHAVAKIFEAKQRPHFDPLIVHLAAAEQVHEHVTSLTAEAALLMEKFWPGPLTLVLPKQDHIPDLVTSGLPSVAIRVPATQLARDLIARADVPIAAPSANLFGSVSPTTAAHVVDSLGGRIDAVLDGGACSIGVESTVISCPPGSRPVLLRPGGLPVESIEDVIGPIQRVGKQQIHDDSPQVSPGMLSRHYAPAKPIRILDDFSSIGENARIGYLAFGPTQVDGTSVVENISERGCTVEAATHFFAALRRLETANIDFIAAKWFPNEGLGLALNDRLRRAAKES